MSSKPTGLDWAAITRNYVAAGGEPQPNVWKAAAPGKLRANPRPYVYKNRSNRSADKASGERGPERMFTVEQEQEIRRKYEDGAFIPGLAKEYGASKSVVRLTILRAGGTIRSKSESMKMSRARRGKQPGDNPA